MPRGAGDSVRSATVEDTEKTDRPSFPKIELHVHLEATVRPENNASIRVLTKAGYRQEGLFERYLDVAGAWRDHLCFAVTKEEIGDGLVSRLVAMGRADLL